MQAHANSGQSASAFGDLQMAAWLLPLSDLLCWSHWPAHIVLLSVGDQQTEAHRLQSGVAVVVEGCGF